MISHVIEFFLNLKRKIKILHGHVLILYALDLATLADRMLMLMPT